MPGARSGTALGPWELSRRDVLNGVLLAAGGGAVWSSTPLRALAEQMPGGACDGAIGSDPRALRGGNSPSTFAVAHWLRDGRLRFAPNGVTLAPGCDSKEDLPVSDAGEDFDVIVVGAGLRACPPPSISCGDAPISSLFCSKQMPPRAATPPPTISRRSRAGIDGRRI